MAACAMDLIEPRTTIFLDISAANTELATLLQEHAIALTIVTNMLDVASVLSAPGSITTIVAGGTFNSAYDGFVGSLTDQQIRQFRFDIAFMGAAGLDAERGAALTHLPEDGLTKAAALSASRRAYLLVERPASSRRTDTVPTRPSRTSPASSSTRHQLTRKENAWKNWDCPLLSRPERNNTVALVYWIDLAQMRRNHT